MSDVTADIVDPVVTSYITAEIKKPTITSDITADTVDTPVTSDVTGDLNEEEPVTTNDPPVTQSACKSATSLQRQINSGKKIFFTRSAGTAPPFAKKICKGNGLF